MLKINEIFYSIQGESTYTGKPCVFVRLTYCNLRCTYCDSEYSFYEGKDMSIEDIFKKVDSYGCKLVEITGGEPLLQKESIILMRVFLKNKYTVMLETGGSLPITDVPKEVIKIIDFKCPSSKMDHKNDWKILKDKAKYDEIKFVIGDENDYNWTKEKIKEHKINDRTVLFSPVHDKLESKILSKWILRDKLNVRFQVQLHKYIWSPETRGV